jgi:hypothetical protein
MEGRTRVRGDERGDHLLPMQRFSWNRVAKGYSAEASWNRLAKGSCGNNGFKFLKDRRAALASELKTPKAQEGRRPRAAGHADVPTGWKGGRRAGGACR